MPPQKSGSVNAIFIFNKLGYTKFNTVGYFIYIRIGKGSFGLNEYEAYALFRGREVGTRQHQEKRQEEKRIGAEGETIHPNPGN